MFDQYCLSYSIYELLDPQPKDHGSGSKQVGTCTVRSQFGQTLSCWYKLWRDDDVRNGLLSTPTLKKMIEWARALRSTDVLAQSVSWPVAQIRGDNDVTVGYLMAGLTSPGFPHDPQTPWFKFDKLTRGYNPDRDEERSSGYYSHPQKIARLGALLSVMNALHKRGIIIGDVFAQNILTPGAVALLNARISPACYLLDTDSFMIDGRSIQTDAARGIRFLPGGVRDSTVAADLARFAVICARSFFEKPRIYCDDILEPGHGIEQLIRPPSELQTLRQIACGESVSYKDLDDLAERWTRYEAPQPHLETALGDSIPWDSVALDVTQALGIAAIPPPRAPVQYVLTAGSSIKPPKLPAQRRLPTFVTVLICLVIAVLIILLGRWVGPGFWKVPSSPTPLSQSPLPGVADAIQPQECLSVTPMEISTVDGLPDDWDSRIVDCGSADSHVQITDVRDSTTAPDCDVSVGCMWFVDDASTYLYNAIPQIGQCFYGYRNMEFTSDPGQYDANDLLLGDCGMALSNWPLANDAAQKLQVPVDQLEPTEFAITALGDDSLACASPQIRMTAHYSDAGETSLCVTAQKAQA